MTILNQLINLMLQKVEVKPVPKQELDDFLSQQGIKICDEYYQFLLNYGNSDFLISDFADLRFREFMDYYTDDKLLDDAELPSVYHYVGIDFNDVPLCQNNSERSIYTFGYGHTDGIPYYGGIKELLFFSLFGSLDDKIYFDDCVLNTKIENKDIFKNYEIKDVHTHCRYFFKDNQWITCDGEFYYYNIYKGGILDLVVDDDCV